MEQLIQLLMDKVGLDADKAKQVVSLLQEHADDIPKWLGASGLAGKLPGGLGNMLGGSD